MVVTQKAIVGHVILCTKVGDCAVGQIDLFDVRVGGQSRERPQPDGVQLIITISALLVLKAHLYGVVADVSRTDCTHTELRVVVDAISVALAAVVVPKAISVRRALAIQQGVAVLDLEKARVRSGLSVFKATEELTWADSKKLATRIVVKQREILVVDRRELGVEF